MRFFSRAKDGGPESTVDAYFLVEIKSLFSIALLRFGPGGRDVYHSHAFNAFTWYLFGGPLWELIYEGRAKIYKHCLIPKLTKRSDIHKVKCMSRSAWCLTIRGPWSNTWVEVRDGEKVTLTHGRKEL